VPVQAYCLYCHFHSKLVTIFLHHGQMCGIHALRNYWVMKPFYMAIPQLVLQASMAHHGICPHSSRSTAEICLFMGISSFVAVNSCQCTLATATTLSRFHGSLVDGNAVTCHMPDECLNNVFHLWWYWFGDELQKC